MMASPGTDIDVALEELESRLERLRSLYEQYFIGMEKIEPSVPRQDVDRRIYALRKVQIRNTAKRFKLQNIIQRYNAFQQYWVRVCREIENGTYHRHVARAQSRFGEVPLTAAARRKARLPAPSTPEEQATRHEPKARTTRSAEEDLQALLGEDPEVALEQALAAAAQMVNQPPSLPGPLAANDRAAEAPLIVATTPPRPANGRAKKAPTASGAPVTAPAAIDLAPEFAPAPAAPSKVVDAVTTAASARPLPPPRPPARTRQLAHAPSALDLALPAAAAAVTAAPVGRALQPAVSAAPVRSALAAPAVGAPPVPAPAASVLPPAAPVVSAGLVAGGRRSLEVNKPSGPAPIRPEPLSGAASQPAVGAAPAGPHALALPVAPAAAAAAAPGASKGGRSAAPPRRSAAPAAKVVKEPRVDSWAALRVPPGGRRSPPGGAEAAPNPSPAAGAVGPVRAAKAVETSRLSSANASARGATPAAKAERGAPDIKTGGEPSQVGQPLPAASAVVVARPPLQPAASAVPSQTASTATAAPSKLSRPGEPALQAPAREPPTIVNSAAAVASSKPARAEAAAPPAQKPSTQVAAATTPSTREGEAPSRAIRPDSPFVSEGPASSQARAAAAAGRAAAERAAEARAQAQAAATSRLDEQRLSQLHGTLVAERRRLNQPGKVSREALAASLRDTETKLRKQYADKNIDFHVVVKDGKAMVKPIVG